MVRQGAVGPIMLGRDHHDPGGTDSPFRETANIKDGSNITADMAVHCYAGNAARGMSLVTLHNGGGVGIGKAINGGFGIVLDGSRAGRRHHRAGHESWDVLGGVARRVMGAQPQLDRDHRRAQPRTTSTCDHVTLPYSVDDALIASTLDRT